MTDQAVREQAIEIAADEPENSSREPTGYRRWETPRLLRDQVTRDRIGLIGLVALVGFLWGRAAGMSFWLDEGIAAGVASHPLGSIPRVLLQDGSPPLYYLLLNVWTSLFGVSNTAMHLLSLLFALATVPAAWWAGSSLFDRRTGWMAALLVVINPFVAYYATETRMYSMAILLSLLSTATFLHTFVFGHRRYLPWFVVSLTLLLYTHNWGLLLGVGAGVALLALLVLAADRRRLLVDAALGFGGVGLLYAPWLPSFLYQVGQRLQPWGRRGDLVWVRDDVAQSMGGVQAFVVLALGAGIGLVAMLQRRAVTRQTVAVFVTALIVVVTLALGWRGSVWAYRYLAVVVAPVILVGAIGLARGGRTAIAALGAAAFVTAPLAVRGPQYQKSNAEGIAVEVAPQLRPGDLVILPDFQMVPLVAHYLPPGLRYATTSGPVPDEDVVDWRNSLERLLNDEPSRTLPPLVDALAPGGHVLMMCPSLVSASGNNGLAQASGDPERDAPGIAADDLAVAAKITPVPDDVPFPGLITLRCKQTEDLLTQRPDLQVKQVLTAPTGVRSTPVAARLLVKQPSP